MADIKQSEKLMLEKILGMNGGYVLEFSNSTFYDFIYNLTKIDIYQDKYALYGDSKAKRLRALWQFEPDSTVGKILKELLECWRTSNLLKGTVISESEELIFNECIKISNRLLGIKNNSPETTASTVNEFLNKEFNEISLEKLKIDSAVLEILNSRLKEINKNIQSGASLSVIIMCGSVLEGILLGVATTKMQEFNVCTASPKDKQTGKVLPFHSWTLSNFIDVAHSIGLLGLDVKKFSHSLRDFRNYIHPYEQMSNRFNPDIDTAKISWQVLRAGISDLIKNSG